MTSSDGVAVEIARLRPRALMETRSASAQAAFQKGARRCAKAIWLRGVSIMRNSGGASDSQPLPPENTSFTDPDLEKRAGCRRQIGGKTRVMD
jgi:hypothetical protein